MIDEEEYICSNDPGDDRGHLVCPWHVHGSDPGVERIPARSCHGSGRGDGALGHGGRVEEDGEQGAHQAVGKGYRRHPAWDRGIPAAGRGNVPYHGVEQHGGGDPGWDPWDRGPSLPDPLYKRVKVELLKIA